MSRFSIAGLRARLMLVVLIAIIPALGLILYTASEQRRMAAMEVQENALRLARLASTDQEQFIEGARQLLISLAQLPEVRQRDSEACNALFASLLKQFPLYATLGAVDAKGDPFCSAIPIRGPLNVAERAWFQRTVQSRGFAIGDYTIGRVSGKASLHFGYPVLDSMGAIQAVVLVGLDLEWLNAVVAKTKLPAGATLTVIDRQGTVLARFPEPEKWVGKSTLETPIVRTILSRGEGTAEAPGMDGVSRLYGFNRLGNAGDAYVSVGIPREVAFAPANRILTRNLVALGIVAVLALMAAWFGSDFFVLRQVNALIMAAKRLTGGELTARTGVPYGKGELGELARTFDQMAAAMEQLIAERRRSEQRLASLHEINTATTSTLDLDAVLNVLMEKIDRFLPYTAVLVWLLNRETGQVERAGCWNLDEREWKGRKLASTPSLVKEAIEGKKPVIASNVQTDPRTLDPEFYRRQGLISYLGVPLLVQNQVVGVLVFLTREAHEFDDDEVEFLSTLAGQAAIAIHNSQLYEEIKASKAQLESISQRLERSLRELSSLHTALTPLAPAESVRELMNGVIERLMEATGADAALIRLRDSSTEGFISAAQRGFPDYYLSATDPLPPGSALHYVFISGEPIIASDIASDSRLKGKVQLQVGLLSCAFLPLKVRGEVRGIVHLASRRIGYFNEEQKDYLMAIARQMGIAMENKLLFEEVKGKTQQLEALVKINRDVAALLDREVLLPRIAEQARKILKVDSSIFRLIEGDSLVLVNASDPQTLSFRPRLRLGESLSGKIVQENRVLAIRNVAEDRTMIQEHREVVRKAGYRSFLGVPLRIGDRIIGTMNFYSKEEREFQPEEIRLITAFVDQAAIAVENANLYQESRQGEEIQKVLKELSQDITSLEVDSLLKKLTEKVREVFKADVSDVRVREKERWQVMGVSGIEPERLQATSTGTARGRSKWIIENRRPLLIPDIDQKKDLLTGEVLARLGLRGYLGVPLFSRGGEVIGILRALTYQPRDFTQEEVDLLQQLANGAAVALENARLLEQTKTQAVELERASKMQADFSAMIAHDLRSPLTAIISSAALLEDGLFGAVNDEQKKWLAKIGANSRNLVDLVNNFLDLSKLESGEIDLLKEEVDLEPLVQNSVENYLVLAREKKISLRGCVARGMPPLAADPRRLDQVLANLISNAIKFTPEGGEIEVGAGHENRVGAKLWVKDNGVGIPAQEIGQIFQKYRQASIGKRSKYKGTGLGLVICKMIVEAHGGRIWVESEEGKGATFVFAIPSGKAWELER